MANLFSIASVIGNIFDPIRDIIVKNITKEEDRTKALAELTDAKAKLTEEMFKVQRDEIDAQKSTLLAELKGNWLQRSWRPVFSWIVIFMILNNYVIVPYVNAFAQDVVLPILEVPDALWNLFVVAFGGYTVGRSFEKIYEAKLQQQNNNTSEEPQKKKTLKDIVLND